MFAERTKIASLCTIRLAFLLALHGISQAVTIAAKKKTHLYSCISANCEEQEISASVNHLLGLSFMDWDLHVLSIAKAIMFWNL